MSRTVQDNPELKRYEIVDDDGELGAFAEYRLHGDVADFIHTQTVAGHEGHGVASSLMAGTMADVRRRGWSVLPYCPFVKAWLFKHPDFIDLVPKDERARFGLVNPD